MSEIVLPPMNAQQEAKTKRLCEMIAEYMGDSVQCDSVISMRVTWPDERVDMGAIFKRLAGSKTGLVRGDQTKSPKEIKKEINIVTENQ